MAGSGDRCVCGTLALSTTVSERHDRGLHGPDRCIGGPPLSGERAAVERLRAYVAAYPTLWTVDGSAPPPPASRTLLMARYYTDAFYDTQSPLCELTFADLVTILAVIDRS